MLVTHEADIAQFAKRSIQFRDGKIRRDEVVKRSPGSGRSVEEHADVGGLREERSATEPSSNGHKALSYVPEMELKIRQCSVVTETEPAMG